MPAHPTEETAESGIFDKVAKESSDSTASSHEGHSTGKAHAMDHQSKGPQISEGRWTYACRWLQAVLTRLADMPPVISKEERKAQAEKLNK